MKEGFTFKWASLKFLKKVIFKNFGGGGGEQKRAQKTLLGTCYIGYVI